MSASRSTVALWFLYNPTAANLLMWVLAISGLIALLTMRQEVFPTAVLNTIEIQAEYRGATASTVESQVVLPIEQSINTLRDIKTVVSEVSTGSASIFVMLETRADVQRALDEIRGAVDGLSSLPADLEPPTIIQVRDDGEDIELGFHGFSTQEELRRFSEHVRQRLLALPAIGQVEVEGVSEPEIAVRIIPELARLYGLSLDEVAMKIRAASFERSGGAIRSFSGEYGLSSGLDRQFAHQFEGIAVIESSTGAPLTLGEIAEIENSFRPDGKRFRINGSPGFMLNIFGAGDSTPQEVSSSVRDLISEIEADMPSGGAIIFDDDARSYADRVGILTDSAMIGLILVLLLLFLVLEARVAFWVSVGLPVAMLGGVAVFAMTPYTINFVSIFAFVIVIGIVVDDAVVVGEAIYNGIQQGMTPLAAAHDTVNRFQTAITLAIVTNIIAFMPILFMPGEIGLFLLAIPIVTTCVFIVSLIEALWILPAHLAYPRHLLQPEKRTAASKKQLQRLLESFREKHLIPWAESCLSNRGLVITAGLFCALGIFCWALSGRMPISLQPVFESQNVTAYFALNPGASAQQVDDTATEIEDLGYEVLNLLGDDGNIEGVRVEMGAPGSHEGSVSFTLVMPEARRFSASEFGQLWRDRIGQPAKLTQLAVDFLQGPGNGRDLTLELAHLDPLVSREAADELVRELAQIPGVGQISYSGNASRSEVSFELMPNGRALGFDESQISSRLRAQLDGLEATRLTRGSDEVRVMVRGETKDRRVLPDFSGLILTSSEGRQVALGEITKIQWQKGEVELRRINGQRVQRIEASIDQRINSKGLVEDLVSEEVLPKLEAHFPGLTTWDEAIDTDEDSDTAQALLIATLAVLATIFVLIGGYVRSLRLSAILLSAVPLSVSGALLGHVLLGLELSAATFLGILALGGLVINSGLLLHLRYTEALNSGSAVNTAMITSIRDRFRPIVLSSATTLIGLAPLIFNPSVQAAPLRPVAVSIGFGMLFSIPVILIILPCIIAALDSRQHQPRTIPIDSLHDGATTT